MGSHRPFSNGGLLGSDPGFINLMVAIGKGDLGRQAVPAAEIDALRAKVGTPEYSDRGAARLDAHLSPNGGAAAPPAPAADVGRLITELRTLIGSDRYGDVEAAKLARLLEALGGRS